MVSGILFAFFIVTLVQATFMLIKRTQLIACQGLDFVDPAFEDAFRQGVGHWEGRMWRDN